MEPLQFNIFVPGFAGIVNLPEDEGLSNAFVQRDMNKCFNKNITCVKKAAREYLLNATSRYPETYN